MDAFTESILIVLYSLYKINHTTYVGY